MFSNYQFHQLPIKKILQQAQVVCLFFLLGMIGYAFSKYFAILLPYESQTKKVTVTYLSSKEQRLSFKDMEPAVQENIFETKLPVAEDEQQGARQNNFVLNNYELLGTVLLKKASYAAILNKSKNESRVFQKGDEFFDKQGKIQTIKRKSVELVLNGEVQVLNFPEKPELNSPMQRSANQSSQTRPQAPRNSPQQQNQEVATAVAEGQTEFTFQRKEIDNTLNNRFGELLKEARVLPFLKDGKIAGYTIKKIVSGSFYEKLGLKNGDLIKKVNGQTIESPERAFALLRLFRNESTIFLEIDRQSTPITFTYHIQ